MKVLQINKYHYLKGGADSVFFNTSQLLGSKGHEVAEFCTTINSDGRSPFEPYFVDCPEIRHASLMQKIRSIPDYFMNKNAAIKIEQLIREWHPDIAHIHNMFNGLSMSILPVLKRYGIPVVLTVHDTRLICPSSYFNLRGNVCKSCLHNGGLSCGLHKCYQDNWVHSWMCALEMFHKEKIFHYDNYINKYIFVSHRFMDFHAERHSYFREKGTVLYNFLPTLKQIPLEIHRGDYIFYYGRITKEKGIITLMEAMKRLPHIKLRIAGTGPLIEELKSWNLKNVTFLGFQSGEALFQEVKNASFVVVPSECEENNPLTIIESYAHGKPVIGSNIGGIPELIIKDTDLLFQAFSIDALVNTIQNATKMSNETYHQISHRCRAFAEEHFDADTHYQRLMAIYNQTMKQS